MARGNHFAAMSQAQLGELWSGVTLAATGNHAPPRFASVRATLDGRQLWLSVEEDTLAAPEGALQRRTFVSPTEPWRTLAVVVDAGGRLVWTYRRRGLTLDRSVTPPSQARGRRC